MRKEESVENISKHLSIYTKESVIKSAYFYDMSMIYLCIRRHILTLTILIIFISSVAISLLQDFEDDIG
jgi:hypothetical protein